MKFNAKYGIKDQQPAQNPLPGMGMAPVKFAELVEEEWSHIKDSESKLTPELIEKM